MLLYSKSKKLGRHLAHLATREIEKYNLQFDGHDPKPWT